MSEASAHSLRKCIDMANHPSTRPHRLALAGLGLATAVALTACGTTVASDTAEISPVAESQDKPNIMMILLDDLGYSDLGAYGGEAETPNIDALAQEGVQFTNFHATPLCAPTRAALMTGQDPHRVGLGSMEGMTPPGVDQNTPGYKGSLEGDFTGIAEVLSDSGYDTYQVGKWHLGGEDEQRPAALGFDQNFTMYDAGASYYSDALRLFNRPVEPVNTVVYERNGEALDTLPADFFATRSYTDEVIQQVDQSVASDQPFFTYLGYTAPHDPLHVENKELVVKYLDVYLDGYNYEELRTRRIERMAELGLIDAEVATRWPDQVPPWDTLSPEQQTDMAYRMAVYAAVIHETDEQIGRVIDHLKDTGEYDNTLIAVVSDNGASASTQLMYETHGNVDGWHGQVYPLAGDIASYGQQGSFPSLGLPNAQVSTGPYFQAKNTLFEGGTRVPAIIKTPGGAGERRIVDTFAHITDLYPTFADYAGGDLSAVTNLLGDSARPVLEGTSDIIGDDEFGAEHFGHRSYRSGDWKLIFTPVAMGGTGDWALYNLADDPGETIDVIAHHSDVARDLTAKWDEYATDTGVVPVDFSVVNEVAPVAAEGWFALDWATNPAD